MIKCKKCKWSGKESELLKTYDAVEMSNLELCPQCNDKWSLIDLKPVNK